MARARPVTPVKSIEARIKESGERAEVIRSKAEQETKLAAQAQEIKQKQDDRDTLTLTDRIEAANKIIFDLVERMRKNLEEAKFAPEVLKAESLPMFRDNVGREYNVIAELRFNHESYARNKRRCFIRFDWLSDKMRPLAHEVVISSGNVSALGAHERGHTVNTIPLSSIKEETVERNAGEAYDRIQSK